MGTVIKKTYQRYISIGKVIHNAYDDNVSSFCHEKWRMEFAIPKKMILAQIGSHQFNSKLYTN